MTELYTLPVTDKSGKETTLGPYKGKVLLIVNTASKCGFTPQFEGLEKLHQKYKDKGLMILGFPCNQFKQQDPGSQEEIESFCQINYGVSFPLFRKIDVNGKDTAPLYDHLKTAAPGLLGSTKVKWNFTKFLVSADGSRIERYATATKPEKLEGPIEALLMEGPCQ